MRVIWFLFQPLVLMKKWIFAYFGLFLPILAFFQLILAYLELMVLIFTVVLISTQKLTRNKNHRFFLECWVLNIFGNLRVFSLRTMVLIKNECTHTHTHIMLHFGHFNRILDKCINPAHLHLIWLKQRLW